MDEDALTPAQHAQVEALAGEFIRQLERVGVDMQAARERLHQIEPPRRSRVSDDEFEMTFTVDVSGIVDTLRALPEGAGTDAFVAAYDARRDSR